jgi:hypothetical protein
MKTNLPNLNLNLNKEFKNENKNQNINNINNKIIIDRELVASLSTGSTNSLEPIKPVSIEKSYTPQNYSGLLQE